MVIANEIYELARTKGYTEANSIVILEWWLRDVKNVHWEIFFSMFHKKWSVNNYFIDLKKEKKVEYNEKIPQFDTYPLALKFAVEEMIKNL